MYIIEVGWLKVVNEIFSHTRTVSVSNKWFTLATFSASLRLESDIEFSLFLDMDVVKIIPKQIEPIY